jgi:hypothetical protein
MGPDMHGRVIRLPHCGWHTLVTYCLSSIQAALEWCVRLISAASVRRRSTHNDESGRTREEVSSGGLRAVVTTQQNKAAGPLNL